MEENCWHLHMVVGMTDTIHCWIILVLWIENRFAHRLWVYVYAKGRWNKWSICFFDWENKRSIHLSKKKVYILGNESS